ncbi:hypothetical protein GCM10010307_46060 [Streptomyces vastus]|uniref:Uncharacterized protein n=1 Tax=Streptomyces vastus TaxID=285451 RepID=A0ABP6DH53_9ACTN
MGLGQAAGRRCALTLGHRLLEAVHIHVDGRNVEHVSVVPPVQALLSPGDLRQRPTEGRYVDVNLIADTGGHIGRPKDADDA